LWKTSEPNRELIRYFWMYLVGMMGLVLLQLSTLAYLSPVSWTLIATTGNCTWAALAIVVFGLIAIRAIATGEFNADRRFIESYTTDTNFRLYNSTQNRNSENDSV